MGTGETSDAATGEHEGEVDPDELAIAVLMIKDAMARDLDYAIAVAAASSGYLNVDDWAAANPRLALTFGEATDDFRNSEQDFVDAVEKHGEAQRGLAESGGYSRDVWHRPPGDPVE